MHSAMQCKMACFNLENFAVVHDSSAIAIDAMSAMGGIVTGDSDSDSDK